MKTKESPVEFSQSYIKNSFKIIIISSIIISLSIIITAFLGYSNTKNSLIKKAKSQDIVFMMKSMASKIDGRIARAVETSRIFAKSPSNIQWLMGQEKDVKSGKLILSNVQSIVNSCDYNYFFVAGVKTRHYYFRQNSKKTNKNFIALSPNNPDDSWFYAFLKSKKELSLNVNYDRVMDSSFLFVNTAMGNAKEPVGITGVALSLNNITQEFKNFKVGKKSNLWMVDEKGIIKLSDRRKDIGKRFQDLLPKAVFNKVKNQSENKIKNINVSQYCDSNNEIIDYAYCKLSQGDWILFYKIPRTESLSLLNSLKFNAIMTVILVLIFFMIIYYFIYKKIANPYKHAMLINMELENKVNIRTQELQESNKKIKDSIEYAKRLQESILPPEKDIKRLFEDSFVIWRPMDIVGGDFFWLKQVDDITILAVGDCTGHGVPGALMTMTVNAILHNIVTTISKDDPSTILRELHSKLKETLNKNNKSTLVDDGLDIAIFCINNRSSLLYAGANMELYIKNGEKVKTIKPQTKGIGYDYIEISQSLCNECIQIEERDIFIVSTDGFIHQGGGPKKYPFGKKRFYDAIQKSRASNLTSMKVELETILREYMNLEQQRDDITVFGFKIK